MSVTNRLSAGVSIFEIDRTLTVAGTPTRNAAFCGKFVWGPADEPRLMETEDTLLGTFGRPDATNFENWFNAANFLSEANGLYVKRVVSTDALNAVAGGKGTGLTFDVSAVNGEVSSVAVNAAGSGYTPGDIVVIDGGVTLAEVRVLAVNGAGAVEIFDLLSTGTGYDTTADVGSTSRREFLIKNDEEFEGNALELPEIIARFPGSFGNSLGVTVVRASEFFGNQFEDRFQAAPAATIQSFDGDGLTTEFTVGQATIEDVDRVVTLNNVTIKEGATPGDYQVVDDKIVLTPGVEQFDGTGTQDNFTIVNADELDLFTAVLTIDGQKQTPTFDGVGSVDFGKFDINPETGVLTVGTNKENFNGDGKSLTRTITTTDILDENNVVVTVDAVPFTVVTTSPTLGEVQIQPIAGGYNFTFEGTQAPNVGISNIRIQWGFPQVGTDNIEITYGLPNGADTLKVFTNQTGVHAVVYDRDGRVTGVEGSVVELYNDLSTDDEAKFETGLSSYYVQSITDRSEYVRITKDLTSFGDFVMGSGSDGGDPSSADYQASYEEFRSDEKFDTTYMIDPVVDTSLSLFLISLAEDHSKAVSFIGMPRDLTLNNRGSELTDVRAFNGRLRSSSQGNINPSWIQIFDRYNAVTRWIPSTGYDAGLYAATHRDNNFWTTPAGFNRGQYRRALQIAWLPTPSERDILTTERINHPVRERGLGFFLFSQLTMLQKESAFSRMNVRFLSIHIKRGLDDAFRFILFEINDEITRAGVRNLVNPFMRQIQANRGVYEYAVKCDGENNPPAVIDANELICDVYIKPTRIAEKIGIFLVYTQTGIAFEEVAITNA